MSWNRFRFTNNEDLIKDHNRSVLDYGFLEQMFQKCEESNPAKKAYRAQMIKEQAYLEELEAEMDARKL
jgi:hypothetical protein